MTRQMYLYLTVVVVLLLPLISLAALSFFSRRPANLGVRDGRFAPCPATPNCVCTQSDDAQHRMEPICFEDDVAAAMQRVKAALATLPGTKIVEEQPSYLRVEATSRWFRFVDDVEIYIDAAAGLIHFRSASRAGRSDFGVNRARMQSFGHRLRTTE